MLHLCFGFVAGVLLSLLRIAPWSSPHDVPALGPWSARLGVLLGLGAIAAGLTRGPRAAASPRAGPALAVGVALGFALHALALEPWVAIESRLPAILAAAACALLLALLAGLRADEAAGTGRAGLAEVAGVFLAAAGLALALSALWRPVTLLTLREPDELRLVALVLLAAVALGAVALGRLTLGLGRGALPLGLWLGAAGSLAGLWAIQPLAGNTGFDRFLRTYGLDLSLVGTWRADGLVAARAWVVPGLLAGAGLVGLRGRGQALALVAGLAAGVAAAVPVIERQGRIASEHGGLATPGVLPIALGMAAAGGALALLGRRGPGTEGAGDRSPGSWRARIAGLVLGAAATAGALALPLHREATFLSPWRTFEATPSFLVERPEGVYTIERGPEGSDLLTLNRRARTPDAREAEVEAELLDLAWLLLPPGKRDGARVLLAGQLDASRDWTLAALGAGRVDRTGTWHDAMRDLERTLLGRAASRPGEVLAPHAAAEAVAAGRYDLVLVPAAEGVPPARPPWDAPAGTVVVAWLPGSAFVARGSWGERVLVHADPLGGLTVGLVDGVGEPPEDAPGTYPAGARVRKPMAARWLALRENDRARAARAATAERLARGARGTPLEAWTAGLLAHYAAQRHSSPWDTPEQATEIDDEALATLRDAALERIHDADVRRAWERFAALLLGRRDIAEVLEHVEPLADAGEPWPELDRVLAHAELERLEPARAAWRLLRVIESDPLDLGPRILCARAMLQAQDPWGAVEQLDAVYAVQPQRPDLDRLFAEALARAGDPRAEEHVRAWLEAHPDDEGMRVFLGPGPYPPVEPVYTPLEGLEGHEGDAQYADHGH